MSNPEAIPEPSMEDILSSIRQIIAEGDDQSPAAKAKASQPQYEEEEPEKDPYAEAAGGAAEDEDDVFDLTDAMVSDTAAESNAIPFPQPAARAGNGADPYAAALGELDEPEESQPLPAAGFDDLEFRTPSEAPAESDPSAALEAALMGQAADDRQDDPQMAADEEDPLISAAAGQAVAQAFGRLTRRSPAATDSRTIEELVVDMLRPMLKDWLDDNLPMLVERLVRAEIERVTRGGR